MPVTTAIVSAQALSGAGTQDFTSSGFGAPDAVMLVYNHGVTADADTDLGLMGYGFWDGTTQSCTVATMRHGTTASPFVQTRTSATYVFNADDENYVGGTPVRTAAASAVTDGVRLTWSAGDSRPWVKAILIKGLAGAKAGTFQPSGTDTGTVDVTGLGITPNCVIVATAYNNTTLDSSQGLLNSSIGFCTTRNSYKQACARISSGDSFNTNHATALYDGYVSNAGTSTLRGGGFAITAMASGQFTVQSTLLETVINTGHQAYLALQMDTAPDVFVGTTPTSGDWAPYTGNFEPEAVLMAATALTQDTVTAGNQVESGTACASIGFYSVNGETEQGVSLVSEDNVATSNVSSRRSAALIIQQSTGGAPLFSASSPTFTSTGLSYASANITHGASGYKVVGLAFEGSSVRYIPTVQPVYYGSTRLANKTGIKFKVTAGHTDLAGGTLGVGANGTTDASGNFILPAEVTLSDEGAPVSLNDPVTLYLYWEEGSSPVVDRSLIVKTTLAEDV